MCKFITRNTAGKNGVARVYLQFTFLELLQKFITMPLQLQYTVNADEITLSPSWQTFRYWVIVTVDSLESMYKMLRNDINQGCP